jgi:hypothetical protein
MRSMRLSQNLSILLLATSLAFIGCKKKDNAAAPPAESATPTKSADPGAAPTPAAPAAGGTIASDDDYIKGGIVLLDKMTAILKGAGTNCDKLADDITKLASDNDVAIKASQAYEKAHPDAKKKFDEATKDQMKAFETVAEPTLTACKDNKKVGDAFTKLVGE